jgi:hypothetical protein
MKPSYFLKVMYPIATVIARIHSPAVAMTAVMSMVFAVFDRHVVVQAIVDRNSEIYLTLLNK